MGQTPVEPDELSGFCMTRAIQILVFVTALVGSVGCVTTSKGPPPPGFEQAREQRAKTESDLARIRSAIESDIASLRARSGSFFDSDPGLYRQPFPLDLFRHAAMACINTPLEVEDAQPMWVEAADRAELSCAVAPTGPLLDALDEEVPGRRPEALQRLRLLDDWRRSRSRMQDRLRQLPRILEQARDWTARQRASTRQTELEIQRRRSEYSTDRYEASLAAVEEQRERLASLETKLEELEEAIPAWSRAVAAEIDYVYNRLSLLGPS